MTILCLLLAGCANHTFRPSATQVTGAPDEAWRTFSQFIHLRYGNDSARVTDAQMADFLRANRFSCSAPKEGTGEATCRAVGEVVTDGIATPFGFIWRHAPAEFAVRIKRQPDGWQQFTAFSARPLPS